MAETSMSTSVGECRCQLALLAFARLLAKDGQPAPVILADVLVYSDDYRIERHVRRPAPAGQRPADHPLLLPPARLLAARRQMLRMTPWSQTADASRIDKLGTHINY
jgi:hypothetical protein